MNEEITYGDLYEHLEKMENCDNKLTKTEEWCSSVGVDFQTLKYSLELTGGFCDCEVLYNSMERIPEETPIHSTLALEGFAKIVPKEVRAEVLKGEQVCVVCENKKLEEWRARLEALGRWNPDKINFDGMLSVIYRDATEGEAVMVCPTCR